MCTRFAGSALALALAACSGQGGGADACRTIEQARCARQSDCDDWSADERDQCRLDRDAACHAGAVPLVRDASDEDVQACADAIGAAECDALDDPFAIAGCEPLAPPPPADAGP